MRNPGRAFRALALVGGISLSAAPVAAQRTFASPDEAAAALVEAARAGDRAGLRAIFGDAVDAIVSEDTVQFRNELEAFTERASHSATAVMDTDDRYFVEIGEEEWPFPVPLVRSDGSWQFDTEAGAVEIAVRRIGRNELATITVCEAIAVAQWDYFLDGDWDTDMVQEFAQQFLSTAGTRDGLYWPTLDEEPSSPIGPLVALARWQGYEMEAGGGPEPYNGYYFRMLMAQGPSAPGGAYDYIINGNMIGGFAVIAWPAEWGITGVMTFIVNQQGRVYEKDLGEDTATVVAEITTYDPDPSWTLAAELIGDETQ